MTTVYLLTVQHNDGYESPIGWCHDTITAIYWILWWRCLGPETHYFKKRNIMIRLYNSKRNHGFGKILGVWPKK